MTSEAASFDIGPVMSRGVVEIAQSRIDRKRSAMAVYYTPDEARTHAEAILAAVEEVAD